MRIPLALFLLCSLDAASAVARTRRDVLDTLGNTVGVSKKDFRCMICHWGAELIVSYANSGRSPSGFFSLATTICHLLRIEEKVRL